MTDTLKPIGQYMKQKSSDEFSGVQGHRAARRVGFAATIEKRDFGIGNGLDAMIGNRHTMRVTSEVFQHGFG